MAIFQIITVAMLLVDDSISKCVITGGKNRTGVGCGRRREDVG